MDKNEQIRLGIKNLVTNPADNKLATMLATVVSVNEDEATCDVERNGSSVYDVRLRPVLNDKEGITLFPKVGSWVMAIRIEDDADWMVMAADEVDKYRVVVDDLLFEMKENKFLVKSGDENLGKCIDDLIIQIQAIAAAKNTAAITLIQNRFKLLLSGT